MEGRRFIQSIRLENILSFGPNEEAFELEPLNVLIGPNASGKSNFIQALSLLHAAPYDIQLPLIEGGGAREWIWKGNPGYLWAKIEANVRCLAGPIRYFVSFIEFGGEFRLQEESIDRESIWQRDYSERDTLYKYQCPGEPVVEKVTLEEGVKRRSLVVMGETKTGQSILAQIDDGDAYPELTDVRLLFEKMAFYREWNFGRLAPSRVPQNTDLGQKTLVESAANLSLVLSDILNHPKTKERILECMRTFFPTFRDIMIPIAGGTAQVNFHEEGVHYAIPATRLSDGSLRYLCLLAVLLHPEPPNVICVEEPELGLHPDIIPEVGKLLIEASKRSQIFVTTHSDILVDSLSEVPEAMVVCEKVDGATQLRRLDGESLKPWLEKYRLGELWTSGRFGGNRW